MEHTFPAEESHTSVPVRQRGGHSGAKQPPGPALGGVCSGQASGLRRGNGGLGRGEGLQGCSNSFLPGEEGGSWLPGLHPASPSHPACADRADPGTDVQNVGMLRPQRVSQMDPASVPRGLQVQPSSSEPWGPSWCRHSSPAARGESRGRVRRPRGRGQEGGQRPVWVGGRGGQSDLSLPSHTHAGALRRTSRRGVCRWVAETTRLRLESAL